MNINIGWQNLNNGLLLICEGENTQALPVMGCKKCELTFINFQKNELFFFVKSLCYGVNKMNKK
jgi:protein-arginine kinase activator protein McsA